MTTSNRTVLALFTLAVIAAQAPAQFDRTALLINVPTADVLPPGSLAGTFGVTVPLLDPATSRNVGTELGGAVRFSPVRRLELALTAYTHRDFVLGASYQVLGPHRVAAAGPGDTLEFEGYHWIPDQFHPSLAIGIHDVGLNRHVSPIGNGDDAWPDWKYEDRPMENFSAFIVASLPLTNFLRAHGGIGRGRYVGYSRGRYLNTDQFLDERHQWAVGLFGGVEAKIGPHVTLAVDADGRDVNAGVRGRIGPVGLSLAATKLEGFTPKNPEDRFGRLAFAVSYRLDNLLARRPRRVPETVPAPEPRPRVEEPETPELAPIYFDFDLAAIRPSDLERLRRNADAISAAGREVLIEGHCCPLGSAAHNLALGKRRAEAARDHLIGLGVDPGLLRTKSYGKTRLVSSTPDEYRLNRRCEFVWQ